MLAVALFHASAGAGNHGHSWHGLDVGRQQGAALRWSAVGLPIGEVAEAGCATHVILHIGQQFAGRVHLGVQQFRRLPGQSAGHAATAPLLLVLLDRLGHGCFDDVLVVLSHAGMLCGRRAIFPRARLAIGGDSTCFGGSFGACALLPLARLLSAIAIVALAVAVPWLAVTALAIATFPFVVLRSVIAFLLLAVVAGSLIVALVLPILLLLRPGLSSSSCSVSSVSSSPCCCFSCSRRWRSSSSRFCCRSKSIAKYSSGVLLRGRPSLAGVIPSSGQRKPDCPRTSLTAASTACRHIPRRFPTGFSPQ